MVFRFKAGPLFDRLWCSIYTFIYLTLINFKSSRVISLYETLTCQGLYPEVFCMKAVIFC